MYIWETLKVKCNKLHVAVQNSVWIRLNEGTITYPISLQGLSYFIKYVGKYNG